MSMAAMFAAICGDPQNDFVGFESRSLGFTNVPLPAAAQVGDLCVFVYYPPLTISGGSGTAWNTMAAITSYANVAWRKLEAADLTNTISLSGPGPVVTGVWRGPYDLSPIKTEKIYTGSSTPMAGFSKSARAIGLIGFGFNDSDPLYTGLTKPPFEANRIDGPSNYQFGLWSMTNPDNYTNGDDFAIVSSVMGSTKAASVAELLY